ncbi:hypothetical protein SRM_01130 [Salinibacter ruber M8]|uniref:Uncharacterized protein n=1 Tax=Salinibacter ruber (strain M8) TaxID=761659 RepID=D5H7P6_SALRM|nr:hypothetical protein SRM_01130 [Salinibacter ruber M8]
MKCVFEVDAITYHGITHQNTKVGGDSIFSETAKAPPNRRNMKMAPDHPGALTAA